MNQIVFIAIVIAGLAGVVHAGSARRTVSVEVAGMTCDGCAASVRSGLAALPGVASIAIDVKAHRVTVVYDPDRLAPPAIRDRITELGYTIGGDDPPVAYPRGADVRVISRAGEDVKVERHLARGKVTIVDFYADWCKPCKALDRRLAARVAARPGRLAIRKVNVVAWDSPVARRYLAKVRGLPYVQIYDARGRHAVSLIQGDVDRIDRHLDRLVKVAAELR